MVEDLNVWFFDGIHNLVITLQTLTNWSLKKKLYYWSAMECAFWLTKHTITCNFISRSHYRVSSCYLSYYLERSVVSRSSTEALLHIQKAWDIPDASKICAEMVSRAADNNDAARLLAAASPYSGNWLHAASLITAIAFHLNKSLWDSGSTLRPVSHIYGIATKWLTQQGFMVSRVKRAQLGNNDIHALTTWSTESILGQNAGS